MLLSFLFDSKKCTALSSWFSLAWEESASRARPLIGACCNGVSCKIHTALFPRACTVGWEVEKPCLTLFYKALGPEPLNNHFLLCSSLPKYSWLHCLSSTICLYFPPRPHPHLNSKFLKGTGHEEGLPVLSAILPFKERVSLPNGLQVVIQLSCNNPYSRSI